MLVRVIRRPLMSQARAGPVWMQFLTAWGALRYLTNVTEGQFVVITAGSSSTGLAAIQVVKDERSHSDCDHHQSR